MGNGGLTMLHSNYAEEVVPMGVTDNCIQEYIAQNTNDTTAPQIRIAESIRFKGAVIASKTTDEESKLQDLQISSTEHNSTNGETQSTQDALPSVNFQGVTGLMASKINGVYRCKMKKHPTNPGEIIEDKKIFYRHQSQSSWRYDSILLNDSTGRWMVLRDNQVLAYCELSGLADPCDAKRWHIANASKSLPSFSVQLSVDVKRASDALLRTTRAAKTKKKKSKKSRKKKKSNTLPFNPNKQEPKSNWVQELRTESKTVRCVSFMILACACAMASRSFHAPHPTEFDVYTQSP